MYRLTHLVSFMQRQYPVNDFDLEPDSEVKVCDAWADIKPITASEVVVADQKRSQATHRIVMRTQGRHINPEWAIIDSQGLRWEIAGVTDINGDSQWLAIDCISSPHQVGLESTR